ncbi:hypothetical protein ANRL4_03648 [Anaerolineae bacterium]|nr:hypothetical protein ANRL4_03648 [Anaerolineae bacterium]
MSTPFVSTGYFVVAVGIFVASYGIFGMYYGKLRARLRGFPTTRLKGLTARVFGIIYLVGGTILIVSGMLLIEGFREGVKYGAVGLMVFLIAIFIGYFSGQPV